MNLPSDDFSRLFDMQNESPALPTEPDMRAYTYVYDPHQQKEQNMTQYIYQWLERWLHTPLLKTAFHLVGIPWKRTQSRKAETIAYTSRVSNAVSPTLWLRHQPLSRRNGAKLLPWEEQRDILLGSPEIQQHVHETFVLPRFRTTNALWLDMRSEVHEKDLVSAS